MIARLLLVLVLSGCASPGVLCSMRDHYDSETPIARKGQVLLAWDFDAPLSICSNCDPRANACTPCFEGTCVICYVKKVPSFEDVCGEAEFGHELKHVLRAMHVPR